MTNFMLPDEYRALCLDKYLGRIHITKKSFRPLEPKEILVKVRYTTVHPYDILFIRGEYGELEPKCFPLIPGFQGSGKIVSVQNESDNYLIDKQVTCFANSNKEGTFEGLWAEYHYTTIENIMIFDSDKEIPYEKITFLIDPLIAVGMYDIVSKAKTKSVLQTDADTQVGQMFTRICKSFSKVETINLVRNYSHVKDLVNLGTPNIIVSEGDWELECSKICHILNTQIAFDTYGGTTTGKILSLLPSDATLYHIINLLLKEINRISISDLFFKGKSLTGFWMIRWLRSLNAQEYQYWWEFIRIELKKQSKIFETKVTKSFKIDDIDQAINFYVNSMNDGFVIINFN